jgi:hypothetical protein
MHRHDRQGLEIEMDVKCETTEGDLTSRHRANEDKLFAVCPRLPSERHATIHASSSHHRIIIFYDRTKGIKHAIQTCQFACVAWREVEHQTYLKLDQRNFAYHKQWLFDFLGQSNDFQATALAIGFGIFGRHKTNLEI